MIVVCMLATLAISRKDLPNTRRARFYRQETKDHGNQSIVSFMRIERMPYEEKSFSRVVGVVTT